MTDEKSTTTLSRLKKGDKGKIIQVENGASSLRLMELGLVAGVELKVSAVSPFGDPIAIEMECCSISMRKSDAELILIEKITSV